MAKFEPRMMPGQEPYTPGEWDKVRAMIRDASIAEEVYSLDELETFADTLMASLQKLREQVSGGASGDDIRAAELAAWSVGATPDQTEQAMREGAIEFAASLVKP